MVSGNFVSIKSIADRLMMNPIMNDLNFEFIIDKAVECLRLVNMPPIYTSKAETIEISKFKGQLPYDIIYIEAVMYNDNGMLTPMNKGSDIMQDHYYKMDRAEASGPELTYGIGPSKITTNFEKGEVVIAYRALVTDEECYPMIPDNIKLIRCIESYIKYRWFDILNDMDKITDRKLSKAEADYCFNIGQAQSDMAMPNEAEMEELVNSIVQILPNNNQFKERMKFLGTREYIKTH
jgi:hypothetical protein